VRRLPEALEFGMKSVLSPSCPDRYTSGFDRSSQQQQEEGLCPAETIWRGITQRTAALMK
jgi:hypothetical protein